MAATACYLRYPSFFKTKEMYDKVVKVVPEYSNWPNIQLIYNIISFPTDIYVYKSC